MFQHPVTEHLPQDIAAELRQRGVDEQVLLFQRLRQGATRSRIRLLHSCVFHEPGNDLQRIDSLVQLGSGLFHFLGYGSQYNLPRVLRIPEIHPVKRCLVITVIRGGHGFQYVS